MKQLEDIHSNTDPFKKESVWGVAASSGFGISSLDKLVFMEIKINRK
jgi:hypothetical protein